MKLEVGKTYTDRLGREVKVIRLLSPSLFYKFKSDSNRFLYSEEGRVYSYCTSDNDLIKEVEQ